jgi:hypothetical protein
MRCRTVAILLLPAALGCGGAGSISLPGPVALAPSTVGHATSWAIATIPPEAREIRFRWQLRDDRGAAGGRGRVRLALPDSARLDVSGPLGSGRAAAFVAGDSAVWAQPEEDVKRLVPNYPLFWALLGVARAPGADASVRTFGDPALVAWRYSAGEDTVDYVRVSGPPPRLLVEVREGGKKVGTVETRLAPDGLPISARLIVPSVPARLDLTFYSNIKAPPFAADTWTPPEP